MAPKPKTAKLPERQAASISRQAPTPANKATRVSTPKAKGKHRPKKNTKATKIVRQVKPKAKPTVRHAASKKKQKKGKG